MGDVVKFPAASRPLTVGDLRKALADCHDDMPVSLEIDVDAGEAGDFAQAFLRSAHVEARCDEVDRLYLWGSYEEDVEEFEAATEIEGET
jgi:hypothetical protein